MFLVRGEELALEGSGYASADFRSVIEDLLINGWRAPIATRRKAREITPRLHA